MTINMDGRKYNLREYEGVRDWIQECIDSEDWLRLVLLSYFFAFAFQGWYYRMELTDEQKDDAAAHFDAWVQRVKQAFPYGSPAYSDCMDTLIEWARRMLGDEAAKEVAREAYLQGIDDPDNDTLLKDFFAVLDEEDSTSAVKYGGNPDKVLERKEDIVQARDGILDSIHSGDPLSGVPRYSPEANEILQAFYDAAFDPTVVAGMSHILSPTMGVRNVMIVSPPGTGKSALFDDLKTQIDHWWEKNREDCLVNCPFADVIYQDRVPSKPENFWGIQFVNPDKGTTVRATRGEWLKPIERHLRTGKPLLMVLDVIEKYPPTILNELKIALAENAITVWLPKDFPLQEYAGQHVTVRVRFVGLANPNDLFFQNPDNAALLNRFAIYKFFKRRWLSPAHANIAGLIPEPEIGTTQREALEIIASLLDDFGDSQSISPVRFYGKAMELLGKQGAHLYGFEGDLVYSDAAQQRVLTAKDLEDERIAEQFKRNLHKIIQKTFPTLSEERRDQFVAAQFDAIKRRLHNTRLVAQTLAGSFEDTFDPETETYTTNPKSSKSKAFAKYWGIRSTGEIFDLFPSQDTDQPNVGSVRNLCSALSAIVAALSDAPPEVFDEKSYFMDYLKSEFLDQGALNKMKDDERNLYQTAALDFLNRIAKMAKSRAALKTRCSPR
ncbi:MAG: hypothetical protein KatS3mg016_2123 [Fimbriimonadales bacterium]|nr:MAG: hypothetical protein KatS3mg016_2123 [Fimbriimonadales bacterium]